MNEGKDNSKIIILIIILLFFAFSALVSSSSASSGALNSFKEGWDSEMDAGDSISKKNEKKEDTDTGTDLDKINDELEDMDNVDDSVSDIEKQDKDYRDNADIETEDATENFEYNKSDGVESYRKRYTNYLAGGELIEWINDDNNIGKMVSFRAAASFQDTGYFLNVDSWKYWGDMANDVSVYSEGVLEGFDSVDTVDYYEDEFYSRNDYVIFTGYYKGKYPNDYGFTVLFDSYAMEHEQGYLFYDIYKCDWDDLIEFPVKNVKGGTGYISEKGIDYCVFIEIEKKCDYNLHYEMMACASMGQDQAVEKYLVENSSSRIEQSYGVLVPIYGLDSKEFITEDGKYYLIYDEADDNNNYGYITIKYMEGDFSFLNVSRIPLDYLPD